MSGARCGENDENMVKIEVSGNKPSGGIVTITNGQETLTSPTVEVLCTKKEGVDLSNLTYENEFACELGDNDAKTLDATDRGTVACSSDSDSECANVVLNNYNGVRSAITIPKLH